MKKLLIALAIAAVGITASAATVDWRVWVTEGSKTANAYDGYTAYLVNATAWDAATISAATFSDSSIVLDSTTFNAGSGKSTYTYKTLDAVGGTGGRSVDIASLAEGSDMNVYYVLLNTNKDPSEYYTISDTLTGRASTGEQAFGTKTSITQATLSGGSWTAVPEPTSGLLMLLGMAGLALRRRRA